MSTNNTIGSPITLADVQSTQASSKLKGVPANPTKIEKSAHEFEAVLLSHWLEQAQQSFATVPGSEEDENKAPGHDEMLGIAMQAIGTSLSGKSGGLGIASLVTRYLKIASEKQQNNANVTKDLQDTGSAQPGSSPAGTEGTKK